mgnify:CR=1 FL=1
MSCTNCQQTDKEKYGFILENNGLYMTIVKEIKTCCAVKVKLLNFTAGNVTYKAFDNNKEYTVNRSDFMKSSWRIFE